MIQQSYSISSAQRGRLRRASNFFWRSRTLRSNRSTLTSGPPGEGRKTGNNSRDDGDHDVVSNIQNRK